MSPLVWEVWAVIWKGIKKWKQSKTNQLKRRHAAGKIGALKNTVLNHTIQLAY